MGQRAKQHHGLQLINHTLNWQHAAAILGRCAKAVLCFQNVVLPYWPPKQIYLKEHSPLAVIALAEEASLGHAGLGHINVHSCSFQTFLQLHSCQLIIQFGIGVCREVTVDTTLPSAATNDT